MAVREAVVSTDDVVLLSALVEHAERRKQAERAEIYGHPSGGIPPPVAAAMNTRVEFEDLDSGKHESVWLVHPAGADAQARRISVLSPVGRALLGKRAGQDVEVMLPGGDVRELTVISVHEEGGR